MEISHTPDLRFFVIFFFVDGSLSTACRGPMRSPNKLLLKACLSPLQSLGIQNEILGVGLWGPGGVGNVRWCKEKAVNMVDIPRVLGASDIGSSSRVMATPNSSCPRSWNAIDVMRCDTRNEASPCLVAKLHDITHGLSF